LDLETDASGLALLVGDREVRQVDRRFLGEDAGIGRRGLLGVATDQVDALDKRLGFGRDNRQDLASLALVLASQDDDLIALLNLGSHYSTSGASEMIFMWFLARTSRGTGPKIRVPIGSF